MEGMKILFLVMALGLAVAFFWDNIPAIKNTAHAILDPSAGALMNWNLAIGFLIIVFVFTLVTTLVQKHMTDQDTLKRIKEEQKLVQEELKLYKNNPEKTMKLSQKSLELTMKAMPITMRPALYTTIPFILFFRWFADYFAGHSGNVFGINWILAYFIVTILFSSILRKVMKVH